VKTYCALGVILYVVLSLADLVLTAALLGTDGEAYEANPIAAAFLERHGWSGLALFKAAGVTVFVAAVVLLARRRRQLAAAVVTFGCLVLIGVTWHTHRLIVESRRENAARNEPWWTSRLPSRTPAARPAGGLPHGCWLDVR
jgi:hypothetical protein